MKVLYFITFAVTFLLGNYSFAQDVVIPFGSISKYSDNFQTPSSQGSSVWFDSNYDDSSWSSGAGQIGYGDNDESTVISSVRTAYFRKSFTLPDICNYDNIEISILKDDGAVVYVNGTEVDRFRMPNGNISYSTFASSTSSDDETQFLSARISLTKRTRILFL